MNFSDLKSHLNPEQRQAVEQIYGPILVLAGPGTGKTQMLTVRIAEILAQTDADPKNILCLTFTDSGAVAMRNRLQQWIGAAAYQVPISTFHSFCQRVMDDYEAIFLPKVQSRSLADDLAKAQAYQAVIRSQKWEFFDSVYDEWFARRDFLGALGNLKRENITPPKLRALIPVELERLEDNPENFYKKKYRNFSAGDWKPQARTKIDHKIAKMYELADLWEAYEKKLGDNGYYDFDDQINWVVSELKNNENLRLDLQEQYQWILVDEYQDTNASQNEIIWQLTEGVDEPNLFAVGDDDQSIYRFQGASVANIETFRDKFPTRTEINLIRNYRSHQDILTTAYNSVSRNENRADPDRNLSASLPRFLDSGTVGADQRVCAESKKIISRAIFGSRYSEINWIVQHVKKLIDQDIPPHEIAILVRKNREIQELARELPKFGIPVSAQVFENIFENESVRILILMLQVFSSETDDEKLFDVLHAECLGIAPEKLLELSLQKNKRENRSKKLMEILLEKFVEKSHYVSPHSLASSDKTESKVIENNKLQNFFTFFITSRQKFWHLRPAVRAEKLLYESGLADWLTQKKRLGDWNAVRKFIDWIRAQDLKKTPETQQTSEIFKRIELHRELNISVKPDPLPQDKNAVQIMTTHKSKGLEFEAVFVPSLIDKSWGNTRSRNSVPLPKLSAEHTTKVPSPVKGELGNQSLREPQGTQLEDLKKEDLKKEDPNAEERRLFFVALTRAKAKFFVSYSQTDFGGRDKSPSIFWHEIPEALTTTETADNEDLELQKLLPVFFTSQEKFLTNAERELLQKRVENFVWSATSLQTYLDCPRRFLYQNLYRLPRRPLAPMALGVALHQALEKYFQQIVPHSDKDELKGVLIQEFNRAMTGQNIREAEKNKLSAHGTKILEDYFEQKLINLETDHPHGFELEYNFGQHSPSINAIRITGKMDKIVYLDKDQKTAQIVDYKSGKPKPIKHGERLWRQLVFYDLLATCSPGIKWESVGTALDFLTADTKGKLQTKTYEVTEADRQQVMAELTTAHSKVMNLEFPTIDNPSHDSEIDYWNNFGK